MKFLCAVLFFTLLGVAFSKKLTEDLLPPTCKLCLVELGISVDILLDNVDDDLIGVEGNADLNKLCECILRKENAVDEKNIIRLDLAKSILTPYVSIVNNDIIDIQQAANDAFESCKNVKADGLGDQIIKISNCFMRYIANI